MVLCVCVCVLNGVVQHVWPIAQRVGVLQHDAFSCVGQYGTGVPVPRVREAGGEHLGAVYLNGKMRAGDVNILLHHVRPEQVRLARRRARRRAREAR